MRSLQASLKAGATLGDGERVRELRKDVGAHDIRQNHVADRTIATVSACVGESCVVDLVVGTESLYINNSIQPNLRTYEGIRHDGTVSVAGPA